ncbi:MAG: DUF393 domain-containing protein [Phycisphaerae bacterium]|nr:DUF393 domain-containing protein [Phycisphaerae bacterium]MDW8261417.1 DUF393 domain-containing protein [Phycisphaerales bacterium]
MNSLDGRGWKLKLLYDGLCPICAGEINFLRRRNRRGELAFEDITAPGFDPGRYGLTLEQAVGFMHAVTPDGRVLRGLEVFVAAYRLAGLSWLAAILGFRPIQPVMNLAYRLFAAVRPRFSRSQPKDAARPPCRDQDRCRVQSPLIR